MAQAPAGGDQNKAPGLLALTWIEFSISLIVVVLRLFTRALIVRHVGLDDIFIVVTLVSCTSDGKKLAQTDRSVSPSHVYRHLDDLREQRRLQTCVFSVCSSPGSPHQDQLDLTAFLRHGDCHR